MKSSNLWSLEERQNRQDFMIVFKTYKDLHGSVLINCLKEMQILKEHGAYFKIANKTVLAR